MSCMRSFALRQKSRNICWNFIWYNVTILLPCKRGTRSSAAEQKVASNLGAWRTAFGSSFQSVCIWKWEERTINRLYHLQAVTFDVPLTSTVCCIVKSGRLEFKPKLVLFICFKMSSYKRRTFSTWSTLSEKHVFSPHNGSKQLKLFAFRPLLGVFNCFISIINIFKTFKHGYFYTMKVFYLVKSPVQAQETLCDSPSSQVL